MESLVFLQIPLLPKSAPRYIAGFGAQVLPFALALSPRFPSFHATERSGLLLLEGFFQAMRVNNALYFLIWASEVLVFPPAWFP